MDVPLSVAAVARRLGVAPATLRTWDRRFGLGPSGHHAGAHRRYTPADLERLLTMRRLSLEGVPIAEAARIALAAPPPPTATEAAFADALGGLAPPLPADPGALLTAAVTTPVALRRTLARLHPRDLLAWWDDVVAPALAVGQATARLDRPGECAVTALTAAALAELRTRTARTAARAGSPERDDTVLLVPRDPPPDLALHVVGAALAAEGLTARLLTGANPEDVAAFADGLSAPLVLAHIGPGPGETRRAADLVTALGARAPARPVYVLRESTEFVERPSAAVHRVRSAAGAVHEVLALLR